MSLKNIDFKVLFHISYSAWVREINAVVSGNVFELKQLGLIFLCLACHSRYSSTAKTWMC